MPIRDAVTRRLPGPLRKRNRGHSLLIDVGKHVGDMGLHRLLQPPLRRHREELRETMMGPRIETVKVFVVGRATHA